MTILMATRNGAAHLPGQLASIAAQTGVDWRLWVSDDGSTDAGPAILRAFAGAQPKGRVRLLDGPGAGAAANFLSLLGHPDLPPGPVAFADQDDVWDTGKLAKALAALANTRGPALYCAATRLLGAPDRRRRQIGEMRPSFGNALVQNFVAGNTAVLNDAGAAALRGILPRGPVPHHDWWLYIAMTGIGGRVIGDGAAVLSYRQHNASILGAHSGAAAGLRRLRLLVSGEWGGWVGMNVRALADHADALTPEAREALAALGAARTGPALRDAMAAHGIRRQTASGTALIRGLTRIGAFPWPGDAPVSASDGGDTSGRSSGTPGRNPGSGSGGADR